MDSGEGSFNKEARVILMELEEKGHEIIKKNEIIKNISNNMIISILVQYLFYI